MSRIALSVVAVVALAAGLMKCSDDAGSNAGTANTPPNVVGTWTSSILLSPDSTINFSIILAADSTDTIGAIADVKISGFALSVPAYRENGAWTVVNDSLVVSRKTCESNTIPSPLPPTWTPNACNPDTARMPINIIGAKWTIQFVNLKPFVPAGITIPGWADDAEVDLIRQ